MGEETFNLKEEQDTSDNNDNSASNKADPVSERQTNQIKATGSIIVEGGRFPVYCITISGEIEGHFISSPKTKTTKYEHVIPQLVSIEESPQIEGLLVLLNTVGGDIEAGLALAELISGMKKPSVSLVLGGGHSIGVPLAVAAKKSFIAKSASMTLHPVRTTGVTLGVPQSFEHFQRMQERITTFVVDNSNISREKFLELSMNTSELVMDIGTILDGQDAVNEGLIDKVGNLSDAFTCLYDMIEESKKNK
ncbi:MAG: Translocation-enhancing protein TepA [Eubacteriales bacterium SKADARSKE-1]|nr:Translocation-enhancing protein TepA [Eubacteriales bacterium SKADARSKE-1]